MNGAEMIRLLIVGDQPGVRKGLLMRLAAEADFDVIGEAADGQTALDDVLTRSLAEQAGAAAFVAKCLPAAILLSAIRQVSQARCVLA